MISLNKPIFNLGVVISTFQNLKYTIPKLKISPIQKVFPSLCFY